MGVVNNRIDIDALEKSSGGGGGGGGFTASKAYTSPQSGLEVSSEGTTVTFTPEFTDYKFILFEFGAFGKTTSVLVDKERFEDETPRECEGVVISSGSGAQSLSITAAKTAGALTGATIKASSTVTAFVRIWLIK